MSYPKSKMGYKGSVRSHQGLTAASSQPVSVNSWLCELHMHGPKEGTCVPDTVSHAFGTHFLSVSHAFWSTMPVSHNIKVVDMFSLSILT